MAGSWGRGLPHVLGQTPGTAEIKVPQLLCEKQGVAWGPEMWQKVGWESLTQTHHSGLCHCYLRRHSSWEF